MKKNTVWLASLVFLAAAVFAGIFLFLPNLLGSGKPPASPGTPTGEPQAQVEGFGPTSTAILSAPTATLKAPASSSDCRGALI